MTNFNQPDADNRPTIPMDALTQIAQLHLDINTLETRDRDALDFHERAVWTIKAALKASYLLGYGNGQRSGTNPSGAECQVAGDLRLDLLIQFAQTATTDAERFVAHTSWTTEDPIATLRAFADCSATNALTPKLAKAAQDILRRLRLDDTA